MKIQHSIEIDGINCTLSFEASHEAFEHLLKDSRRGCEAEELEALVLLQSDAIPRMLAEARKSFYSNLLTSYNESIGE